MPTDYYCHECDDRHMYKCPVEVKRLRQERSKA